MTLALVIVAFFGMEVLVYLSHRFVMHGPGMPIHKSHHQRRPDPGLERNDLYPLMGSVVAMSGFGLGLNLRGFEVLLPIAIGLTVYGVAYFFVHDIYIHRRLPWFSAELSVCERLKAAHRIHHLWGGEPYGMLFPVVPAALWERAAGVDYDPFPPARPRSARGSAPSQVPVEP
ncbi:MAG: sterol desaturase family protein [Actinomycetota bacterium]|nr:sterol desaturase family protein [Actinomycetota bacterium]MDP8953473.1 sterol desaturase family protein [Actinomycetota bacterium]